MKRVIVGISGATGVIYGIRLLEVLRGRPGIETHLVVSKPAARTIAEETRYSLASLKKLASSVYPIDDIGAAIASGSFKTDGMVVIPCSVRSASAIAHGLTDNLLIRAADVVLKERRKLVLVVRESPLHLGHLRSLVTLAEIGAIILPPMPAFYPMPKTIDEIVDHTVGRVLDHFEIENDLVKRWR